MPSTIEDAARKVGEDLAPTRSAPSARWRWGTVVQVDQAGTMTVEVAGTPLVGIRCARHVMGAQVGDRVRVAYYGTDAVVDAVRATETMAAIPTIEGELDAASKEAWLSALGLGAPYTQNYGDWVNLFCWGHIGILTVVKQVTLSGSWVNVDICTVPEGYRPSRDSYVAANWQGSTAGNVTLHIDPSGVVQARVRGGTNPNATSYVSGTLVWAY